MFIIFCFGLSFQAGLFSYAQTKKKTPAPAAKATAKPADSATVARQRVLDSTRRVQQHMLDSMKTARTHYSDSVKVVRKHTTDSLATVRKYRESKKYQDSVAHVRQAKIDKMRASQKQYFDSLKAVRKKTMDSTIAIRKHVTDSVKKIQQHRTDSLATIRKYKESKRYRDSTSVSRQLKMDSMRAVRKHFTDSSIASRKHVIDSANKVRKAATDSVTAIRKHSLDSLKAIRKVKTDSLAKVKESRLKDQKAREKLRQDKMKLALELKIKKRHEAWNNEKMLKKKWSLPRQAIQNTFTRYNYYFNADKRMDEALANMQRANRENLDSIIALFPFDPDRDSTKLASDMDSIIRKVSVGTQIHDPRTKWGDDLYLLLGQAYFYKGNYENAITSFRYTVSMYDRFKKKPTGSKPASKETPSISEEEKKSMLDFIKHRSVHNEALLWLARTYTQAGRFADAESVLDLLGADSKFPEDMRGRLALENAFLSLKQKNIRTASQQLPIVAADDNVPYWLRLRATYLSGQLAQKQNDFNGAAGHFRDVIDMNPKIEMDFYARKNLAYSLMLAGGDQKEAIAALKRMLNDGKYATYYEQVYFILGQLSINSNNTKDALVYLQKSISSPKSTRKQKALSFASMGGVYYNSGNYELAKLSYDSAAILGGRVPDTAIAIAVRRSKALDEVTGPLRTIHTQDSLLALGLMSEKEQHAAIKKYIRHLEQLRADSAYRAENGGLNSANLTDAGSLDNNVSSWYFSNAGQMQQGQNDFKRKWGSRPLADNWRVSSLSGFTGGGSNTANSGSNNGAEAGNSVDLDENGLPTEASLVAFIPTTKEKQDEARLRIQRGYIDLANAYVRQLEDYPRATQTLDTLEKRFPTNDHKAQAYYLRYLIALRQNQLDKAQEYSQKLQQEFPSSQYTSLVRPSEDSKTGTEAKVPVTTFYNETYDLMQRHEYTQVIHNSDMARRQYGDVRYQQRFTILEGEALAATGNYNKADTLISDYLKNNPSDSLKDWAEAVMNYITKNRPVPVKDTTKASAPDMSHPTPPEMPPLPNSATTNNTNNPAQPNPPSPGADSSKAAAVEIPATYTYKPSEEHYFVFAFNKMEPRAMGVKAGLTDMNSIKFSGLGLSTGLEMLSAQSGMVIVKSFKDLARAKIYMNALKTSPQVLRDYNDGEYNVFLISAKNLLKLKADKNLPAYLDFYKKQYK
ncbi:type IX secretion system periplasmic lipoprotein PorW/SprE [Taibaiella soli]|uniref:type IX secretion system periplasmic lipoprotein PorW/SprE n=1 Tax=Taibaiella soli TaxID=1649169 RepID=UPI000F50A4F3|nr:tetratricopeptide repeat protein [Taibaiella soli]